MCVDLTSICLDAKLELVNVPPSFSQKKLLVITRLILIMINTLSSKGKFTINNGDTTNKQTFHLKILCTICISIILFVFISNTR